MKNEFLKGLGLTEEQIAQIQAENGKDIEAVRANEVKPLETKVTTLTTNITDLTNQVKEFEGVDIKKLQGDVANWETKYNEDLAKERLSSALNLAIAKSGVKSDKALKGFLDEGKIRLKDDGQLEGFNEQLEIIKKENAYLFKEEAEDVNLGGGHKDPGKTEVTTLEDAIGNYYK